MPVIVRGPFPIVVVVSLLLARLVAVLPTAAGRSFVGTSLPCEAPGEDPDESNPRDNLSCPFADELECLSTSQLCDGVNTCETAVDEGSGGSGGGGEEDYGSGTASSAVSLDCVNRTFQCYSEGESFPLSALCNGTNECDNGLDETNVLCENKCLLPYYGGCPYTRKCISLETGASCGECLDGFIHRSHQGDCVVQLHFEKRSYYASAMAHVTEEICVVFGAPPVSTLESLSTALDISTFSATVMSFSNALRGARYEITLNVTQQKYCFWFGVFNYRPYELGLLSLHANSPFTAEHIDQVDLYIYREISYEVFPVFTKISRRFKENKRSGRFSVSVAAVSDIPFSPLIADSNITVTIVNGSSFSFDNESLQQEYIITFPQLIHYPVIRSDSAISYRKYFFLPIINDELVEREKSIILGLSNPTGLFVLNENRTDSRATITLIDDDYYVMVNLTDYHFKVAEDDDRLKICASLNTSNIVKCAVNYEFHVKLSISSHLAEFVADYAARSRTFRFHACQDTACVSIPIVDDDIAENDESFTVSLERTSDLDSRISLSSDTALVTILDDDDMLVGFSQVVYTTDEAKGKVSICVNVFNTYNGNRALRPFRVALLPDEAFETSNTADDCYKIVDFSISTSLQCHNYSIRNDDKCELEMFQTRFKVQLSIVTTNDTKLRVNSSLSTATIFIDDKREPECFVSVGFTESQITVSEHQESVGVCVNSTSPGIEEEFVMNITTDSTDVFIYPRHLQFMVNASSLSDAACYREYFTDIFNSEIVCDLISCNGTFVTLKLAKSNEHDRVTVDNERSTIDLFFEVPSSCECSTPVISTKDTTSGASLDGVILAITASVVIVLVLCLIAAFFLWKKRGKRGRDVTSAYEHHYYTLGETRRTTLLQHLRAQLENKRMIYSKDQLQLSTTVGQGESGLVYKAYIKTASGKELVAVKTGKALFSTGDLERLAKEVSTMLSFSHENVMSLIGVCIDGEMPLLIMPFMSSGSVLDFVRRNKQKLLLVEDCTNEEVVSAINVLLRIGHHISKGMEYLSVHKFVHRDLAARNCMIDGDGVIKVADFGLTEDMYGTNYFRQEKSETGCEEKVPIRWMAPESIEYNIYTQATDVWSFGVTMWEIFSCGSIPYGGIHAMSLLKELQKGQKLEKPNNVACSDDIYEVMTSCWEMEPNERPDFSHFVGTLNTLLERDSGYLQLTCAATSMNTLTAAATPGIKQEMVTEIDVNDGDLECSTSFIQEC